MKVEDRAMVLFPGAYVDNAEPIEVCLKDSYVEGANEQLEKCKDAFLNVLRKNEKRLITKKSELYKEFIKEINK